MIVDLRAWQELDMLVLAVDIRLPTQNQYLDLKEKEKANSKKKESKKSSANSAAVSSRRQKRLAALSG